jgi:hypothetical protein
MGDLRPDNGSPPDDGGGAQSRGLPDLPPEWGTIVIPDDAAELSAEADALRRELRGTARRARIRKILGLSKDQSSSLGIPVVIMTVAILTTLVSLLVVTWGNQPNGNYPINGTEHTTAPAAATGPAPDMHTPLADLTFPTATGVKIRLASLMPMIVLLVDGCACEPLISGVAGAVPPGVKVVPVSTSATPQANDPANVVRLADREGTLRARLGNGTLDGKATVIVLKAPDTIVARIQHVTSPTQVEPLDPES